MIHKILIIDDSAMLRRIAASVLRAQPARYEVLAATRAVEGFAQACGAGAQLIFVDYRIAGANQLDFCERLLNESRTAGIPVVLLLGRDVKMPNFETLPANVVDALRKPFAPEQLAGLVNLICSLSKVGLTRNEIRARLHPPDHLAVGAEDSSVVEEAITEALTPRATALQPVPASAHRDFTDRAPDESYFSASKLLKAPSLRSVFQDLVEKSFTGVLRFNRSGRSTTDVYVENGRLLVVSTKDASTYSEGALELLSSRMSPATLEEAVNEQARSGVPFLLTLGARGLLSKAAAVSLLQRFGKRQFARLWSLRPKAVEFESVALESLPAFALRLEAVCEPIDQWLLDSLRQLRTEDVAADIRHEGCVGTPTFLGARAVLLQTLNLTDEEECFVRQVNGRNDLPSIAKAVGITTEMAYLQLYHFRCLEVMDYRPAPAPFVMTPRTNVHRVLPLKR